MTELSPVAKIELDPSEFVVMDAPSMLIVLLSIAKMARFDH